ncbi:MAG: inner membrane protein [Gammaproteobacteria bacterium]|jgi:inner membrane protein
MDPITQGALGATLPQALQRGGQSKSLKAVGLIGALAGMSPDLDVLIRSSSDPLLALEFHRHFTHSLIFIPVGALLCALILHGLIGRRCDFTFLKTFVICLLGYATHALLDACTTYGTQLFWPFSSQRVAWNNIAVIDPLYTLPILIGIAVSIWKKNPWYARLALGWILLYPALGFVQKQRVEAFAHAYLVDHFDEETRGAIVSISAKPSFANIVLWKIIIETEGEYFVDAIRLGPFQREADARYYEGEQVKKLEVAESLPWLNEGTQQALDLERFRWFSSGFIALDPIHENRVIDIRYSMLPDEINALWSIQLDPEAEAHEHVVFSNHREMSAERRDRFLSMLFD